MVCAVRLIRYVVVNVTALTDDKALMMISCEAGAYNTIDLAWIVSRKAAGLAPGTVALPFNNGQETNELELMNATFDEKSRELVTLAKGRGLSVWHSGALAL